MAAEFRYLLFSNFLLSVFFFFDCARRRNARFLVIPPFSPSRIFGRLLLRNSINRGSSFHCRFFIPLIHPDLIDSQIFSFFLGIYFPLGLLHSVLTIVRTSETPPSGTRGCDNSGHGLLSNSPRRSRLSTRGPFCYPFRTFGPDHSIGRGRDFCPFP